MSLPAPLMTQLNSIFQGGYTPQGHAYANPKSPIVRALEKDGHIEGNPAVIDPTDSNRHAYRVSATGAALVAALVAAANPTPPTIDGVVVQQVPAKRRGGRVKGKPYAPPPVVAANGRMVLFDKPPRKTGGARKPGAGRQEIYPFATLEAPNEEGLDSFFVATSDAIPHPERLLASAVNAANKRYADRKFKVIATEKDPENQVAGARAFRIS